MKHFLKTYFPLVLALTLAGIGFACMLVKALLLRDWILVSMVVVALVALYFALRPAIRILKARP